MLIKHLFSQNHIIILKPLNLNKYNTIELSIAISKNGCKSIFFKSTFIINNEIVEYGFRPRTKKEIQLDIVALSAKENNAQAGRQFIIGLCKYKN